MKKEIRLNTIVELFTKAVNFLMTVIISRIFGPEALGIISTSQAITGYITLVGDFGTNNEAIRRISKSERDVSEVFSIIFYWRLILASFLIIGIVYYYVIFGSLDKILLFYILISLIGFFIPSYIFIGLTKYKYNAIINFLITIISLSLFLLLLSFKHSIIFYPVSLMTSTFIGMIISLVFYFKIARMQFVSRSKLFNFIKKSFYLGLTIIFARIYYDFDIILLGFLTSKIQLGLYSSAFKLIQMLWFIPTLYTTYALPYTTRMIQSNINNIPNYIIKVINNISLFILPICTLGYFYSGDILSMFFGNEFDKGGPILTILIFSFYLMFCKTVFGNLLIALRKEKFLFKVSIVGSFINICLNLLLIPVIGILGSALTTLITEVILFIIEYITIKRSFKVRIISLNITKIFIGITLMFLFLLFIKVGVFLGIILGCTFYLVILLILKEDCIKQYKDKIYTGVK
ncbi:flippase [Neobacillus sp. OS1-33]|uniref:flippase n=1 Tax=Neobacillus sp. OS1-33 TaxID=3070683 RepID=UPI0027E1D967|nr:flippase [Neobacillus sp. OS1-33]WML24562.1 flippase [Neobacillus sp. OS1-33]